MASLQHQLMEFMFSIYKLDHTAANPRLLLFIWMVQKNRMLIETKMGETIPLAYHHNLSWTRVTLFGFVSVVIFTFQIAIQPSISLKVVWLANWILKSNNFLRLIIKTFCELKTFLNRRILFQPKIIGTK